MYIMGVKLISGSKAAKALGVSRLEFLRLAEIGGVRCIYTRIPQPTYSKPTRNGARKFYVPDVIKLVDSIYKGDDRLLNRIIRDLESHNDPKAHIVNDNSELANKLISEGAKVVGDTVWQEVTSR